jgi:phosphotransferase system enzyme I (PtsI)
MAGNPRFTRLLLGMGLREFSVPPNALLEIKQIIASSDTTLLAPMVQRLMRTSDLAARSTLFDEINNAVGRGC